MLQRHYIDHLTSMSAQAISPQSIFDIPAPAKPRRPKKAAPRARVETPTQPLAKKAAPRAQRAVRTSKILRDLLANNPGVQDFTVEMILGQIGTTSFGTSLMFFAIPEVLPLPIPGVSAIVVLPTGAIALQMAAGKKQIILPQFLRNRSVPRKALAAAIYAILPILEKSEKVTKPRWKWATDAKAQRILGVFIFLLAAGIALPLPGFNMPQAIAIFTIGLGLVEQDGLIVCLGVVIGLLSLVLLGAVLFGLSSLLGFGGQA
jgi:hypothetical protein